MNYDKLTLTGKPRHAGKIVGEPHHHTKELVLQDQQGFQGGRQREAGMVAFGGALTASGIHKQERGTSARTRSDPIKT